MDPKLVIISFSFISCALASPIVTGFSQAVEPSNTEFPFQVNLVTQSVSTNEYTSFCGGSLIHPHWVLTAAHCIQLPGAAAKQPDGVFLAMGSIYINANDAQVIGAEQLIVNNKFVNISSNEGSNDVAVIKTKSPFKLGQTIGIIALQNSSQTLYGQTAYLTGFGAINDLMMKPVRLRKATFTIGYSWQCLDLGNEETNLCTVSWIECGGKSCKGDSGGPLFISDQGRYVQIGLVSRGSLGICQFQFSNTVFTKVSAYTGWIMNATNNLS